MGSAIVGTGISIPDQVVTNDDLARIMDTSDEWIRSRSGVRERHFAPPGTGASDLAADACRAAIADAGVDPADVDALITATMTPDSLAPGIAALVQAKLGLHSVAAYDIRQQCSGFLYGLDLADALLRSGKAATVVVVGAEVHAGFLPWGDNWEYLLGRSSTPPTDEQFAHNTRFRGWSVLFGDGAGAAVLTHHPADDTGILASRLHTDGNHFDLIHVPGVGFTRQPYLDATQLEAELHLPTMKGRELFRMAVTLMPEAVREVLADAGADVDDVDLVVAHQANARIVDAVRRAMDLPEERVPINIDRHGNTTAATLPILFHELRMQGRVSPGTLTCFTSFGAGAHWGATLHRQP
jgi:3-oxoacyl-[acyl-carrier-protein] synthase-3